MDQEYNKLVIFDLDGVLVDTRELHFSALDAAIRGIAGDTFVISKDEHLSTYDGLPTRKKLEMLSRTKGLQPSLHDKIWTAKQKITKELFFNLRPSYKLISIFSYLKSQNFKIAVATNSISSTVDIAVKALGLQNMIDKVMSNENVDRSKPFPDMYWECMKFCNSIPRTTLIIEDSHIGRQGAIDSGAFLMPVENPNELTLEGVMEHVKPLNALKMRSVPWRDSKLNVLIPMAGAGSRFEKAGYTFPKPLIDVNGRPMIQTVVENLNIEANYIFIVQKSHYEKYHLDKVLNQIAPDCKIVQIDGLTEGAACTALKASEYINNSNHLLIANSDQYVEWNSNEAMYAFSANGVDGGILTFESLHPKWSYAKLDDVGFVSEVAEKNPISNHATCGIYYWNRGSDFVNYANQMIADNVRVNNEFYIAPVFNWAIKDGKKFRIKEIERMWGLGTPEDLSHYLKEFR